MIENVITAIMTAVIYGVILLGSIIPVILILRTKYCITRLGYKKHILIIAILEALLLLSAVFVLLLLANPFYNSIVWNKPGIGFPIEFFIAVYQLMMECIVPVYFAIVLVTVCIRKTVKK